MMSLNLLSLLGFRLCTRLRARVEMRACRAFRKVPYLTATPYSSKGTLSSTTDLREIGGFLLSEDILKAGNYDHPLQKYRKREYIKPLYSLSTHAQSSMNPRHCEM